MAQVEMNKNARLSDHFSLSEMCKTSAKTPDGNIPSHVHVENLKRLCGWLEMLRKRYNERYVMNREISPRAALGRDDKWADRDDIGAAYER